MSNEDPGRTGLSAYVEWMMAPFLKSVGDILSNSKTFLQQMLSNAQTYANNASNSAAAAHVSENNAASSAAAAEAAESSSESIQSKLTALWLSFSRLYYGEYAADPSTDPNGNPPIDGALYYNTTTDRIRVYDAQNKKWVDYDAEAQQLTQNAALSASAAAGSAAQAANSATSASNSASAASTSATNAKNSETNAGNSASAASTSANNAKSSENNAAGSATAAGNSASAASNSANAANQSAQDAAGSASSASGSAGSASNSASSASTSASNASKSATAASNSASAAGTSETNARNSASAAGNSASAAAQSATNAGNSATAANNSASAASGSASAASNSAGQASASANTASQQANNAGNSANSAGNSANSAASSASSASGSAGSAASSANSANSALSQIQTIMGPIVVPNGNITYNYIRVTGDGTRYEPRSPSAVLSDIGGVNADYVNNSIRNMFNQVQCGTNYTVVGISDSSTRQISISFYPNVNGKLIVMGSNNINAQTNVNSNNQSVLGRIFVQQGNILSDVSDSTRLSQALSITANVSAWSTCTIYMQVTNQNPETGQQTNMHLSYIFVPSNL